MTGLLARAFFEVGRDLRPAELGEAVGSAAKISGRVDRRVIRADQGDDITGEGRLRMREALFNFVEPEIYRAIEETDSAARRTATRHRRREWICALFRTLTGMKPNLSRLASDDRNVVSDVDPLRDHLCHSIPPLRMRADNRFSQNTVR